MTLLRDRLQWARRARTRWDETRREIYVAFLHAANEGWREGHLVSLGEPFDGVDRCFKLVAGVLEVPA